MHRLTTLLVAAAFTLSSMAQTAREEIKANKYLSGSNYLDYDRQLPTQALTPAPEGYTPFYMSHYGSVGSMDSLGMYPINSTERKIPSVTATQSRGIRSFIYLFNRVPPPVRHRNLAEPVDRRGPWMQAHGRSLPEDRGHVRRLSLNSRLPSGGARGSLS